jgi:hypothetical protein
MMPKLSVKPLFQMVESNDRSPSWSTSTSDRVITLSFGRSIFAMKTDKNGLAAIRPMIMATNRNLRQWRRIKLGRAFVGTGQELRLTRIRLQPALYLCGQRGSLPENTARWQVCLSKDVFRRRLESVEREKLNPPAGLRASHEWMGDVSTIPEAGRQNPGSDKTPSSSTPQDSTQPDELEEVMSLETALVRALQRHGAIW